LGGEELCASILAKRLRSLGARPRNQWTSRDFSQFCIDKYGPTALKAVMKAIVGYQSPVVPVPVDYDGVFLNGKVMRIFFFY
jgi:hypothetical protein